MARKMKMQELEDVLMDQIEKLNDDTILDKPEEAKLLIERSKEITGLANSVIEINRTKLEIVKELNRGGNLYEKYLGIEANSAVGKA